MMQSADGSMSDCPVCGGPAKESQVWIETWRGGSEELTIWLCEDDACEAHRPMISHNL
ncbi:MAG TPA: hypothetical protein VJR50_13505 [Mycobacterium sp.]|jgi:hypothetical protein|nr:hypothetical protein [Mycobacterium sp.]